MKFNQAPLFLLMNPKPAQGSKELPVLIHESEAHTLDGQSKMIFVQLAFQASNTKRSPFQAIRCCSYAMLYLSFLGLPSSLVTPLESRNVAISALSVVFSILCERQH